MVRVKYLRGKKIGWVTEYKEDIAVILSNRGEVEILGEVREDAPEEKEVTANDFFVTKELKKSTLIKIAVAKGANLDELDGLKKKEIINIIATLEPPDNDGNIAYFPEDLEDLDEETKEEEE